MHEARPEEGDLACSMSMVESESDEEGEIDFD